MLMETEQTVEGLQSKDMATVGKYHHTWELQLRATKAVLAVFHLSSKDAKRELKINNNNESIPFCSEPTYLGGMLDRAVLTAPRVASQNVDMTSCILEAACWLCLGCFSNNVANRYLSPGPFNNRVMRSCLVPQFSHPPHLLCHQRRLASCDWMPASYRGP